MFAPHKRGEPFACDDLKPALGFPLLDHTIEGQRGRDSFQGVRTKSQQFPVEGVRAKEKPMGGESGG